MLSRKSKLISMDQGPGKAESDGQTWETSPLSLKTSNTMSNMMGETPQVQLQERRGKG